MLAPMQRQIDLALVKNEQERRASIKLSQDMDRGRCVTDRQYSCDCVECEQHDIAYAAINDTKEEELPKQAMMRYGLTETMADKWVDIFIDLGEL